MYVSSVIAIASLVSAAAVNYDDKNGDKVPCSTSTAAPPATTSTTTDSAPTATSASTTTSSPAGYSSAIATSTYAASTSVPPSATSTPCTSTSTTSTKAAPEKTHQSYPSADDYKAPGTTAGSYGNPPPSPPVYGNGNGPSSGPDTSSTYPSGGNSAPAAVDSPCPEEDSPQPTPSPDSTIPGGLYAPVDAPSASEVPVYASSAAATAGSALVASVFMFVVL